MDAPDVLIRYPTREDVLCLAATMRDEDQAEVLAASGHTPLQAVEESLAVSTRAVAIHLGGKVACLAGVAPREVGNTLLTSETVGVVWLLTSAVVDKRPRAFFALSRQFLASFQHDFSLLVQFVDARYLKALRYLNALGFEIHPAQPYGVEGLPFHPVTKRR